MGNEGAAGAAGEGHPDPRGPSRQLPLGRLNPELEISTVPASGVLTVSSALAPVVRAEARARTT